MPRDSRVALIEAVESARNSRVLSIVLGDRPNLETRMAPDLIPLASRHLRAIGSQERIDLLLYTTGGDIVSAFRLVTLIREYCSHFSVLVPFRCQSAGTLLTLGADEIVMLPEGQLSPVDPSVNGPYNPPIPGLVVQPGAPLATLPVSVEEVVGYINLAREIAGIEGEAGRVSVFERLTSDVRPLALGQVFRSRTQIRMLSRKLLQFHMPAEDARIDAIIETLTEKLYSHDYLLSRREAGEIGLKIVSPEPILEKALYELYQAYETDLNLLEPFNPLAAMAQRQQMTLALDRAMMESSERLDAFQTEATLALVNGQLTQQTHFEGWRTT